MQNQNCTFFQNEDNRFKKIIGTFVLKKNGLDKFKGTFFVDRAQAMNGYFEKRKVTCCRRCRL